MAHTLETFLRDYPEFATLETAAARKLEQSKLMLAAGTWGRWHEMAQGLWTAHYLALSYDVTAGCRGLGRRNPYEMGGISSMSAGPGSLSVTRSVSGLQTGTDPLKADYARTTYGLELLQLLQMVMPLCGVVLSADASDSATGAGCGI